MLSHFANLITRMGLQLSDFGIQVQELTIYCTYVLREKKLLDDSGHICVSYHILVKQLVLFCFVFSPRIKFILNGK